VLTYAFGFEGVGEQQGSAFFELAASYPEMNKYYGLISGLAYTIPYSLIGLFMGSLADKFNRKFLLGFSVMMAGIS